MKKSKVYKVYLIYFICMAVFCCLRIASAYGLFNALNPEVSNIVYTLIIQVGIMVILPFTLYTLFVSDKKSISQTFKDTGFKKVGYRVILISLALGLLAFFANIIISTLFGSFLSFFGYNSPSGEVGLGYQSILPAWATFLIQIVLVAVLPAICEEFLHRGVLLGGSKQIGVKKAILISSLLFGLIHFNINQFFYAFILGMLMALVVVVTRSIVPSIIIHFVNNALSVYLSSAEANGWFGQNFYNVLNNFLQSNNALLTFIAIFAFTILVLMLIVFLVVKLFKISTLNNVQNVIKDIYSQPENNVDAIEKNKIIQELIEKETTLNINYENIKSPIDIVLPKQKNIYKSKAEDNIFLISSYVLGGLVTFFTFCWGLF